MSSAYYDSRSIPEVKGYYGDGFYGTPSERAAYLAKKDTEAKEAARIEAAKNAAVPGTRFQQDPSGNASFASGSGGSGGSYGSSGGSGGGTGGTTKPGMTPQEQLQFIVGAKNTLGVPRVSNQPVGPSPAEIAAREAAFARAKDKIGGISRSALDALRNNYAGAGNLGALNRGVEGMLGEGAENLSNFVTQQALDEAARTGQIADRNYSGDITQRGQDMSNLQSLLGLLRLY